MTQATDLLSLLRERGSYGVTPMEALERVGTLRLAARVFELRKAGHLIASHTYRTPNGADVAKYVLIECSLCAESKAFLGWHTIMVDGMDVRARCQKYMKPEAEAQIAYTCTHCLKVVAVDAWEWEEHLTWHGA